MNKNLKEAIVKDKNNEEKGGLSKLIENNKGIVKALGIASFIALAGYSTAQLLKDKKLMKKIKDGLKTPKAIKYIEEFLSLESIKDSEPVKAIKEISSVDAPGKIENTKVNSDKPKKAKKADDLKISNKKSKAANDEAPEKKEAAPKTKTKKKKS